MNYRVTSGKQTVPLGESANGAYVGYDQVTVLHGDQGENGKSVYYYINNAVPLTGSIVPGLPATQDNSNGTLLRSEDYAYDTSMPESYRLVKQFNVETETFGSAIVKGQILFGRVHQFDINTIRTRVQKEESRQWLSGAEIKEVTTFSYIKDTQGRGFKSWFIPNRITKVSSTGQVFTTRRRYPDDMFKEGREVPQPYEEMRQKNMLSYLIEEEQYVDNVLQTYVLNHYKKDVSTSNLVLPSLVQTQFKNEQVEDRVRYLSYDNVGNVLSATKIGGAPILTIWGHDKKYMVAEVKNVFNPSGFAFTGFESDDMNSESNSGNGSHNYWTYSNAGIVAEEGFTGTHCYNISLGSIAKSGLGPTAEYTITYWAKRNIPLELRNDSNSLITGGEVTILKEVNGWTLFEHRVTLTNSVVLTGWGYVDDVRLYPAGGQMTTYSYNGIGNLTSSTDANGYPTFYDHDHLGRLMNIRDLNLNIIQNFKYNHLQLYGNQAKSVPQFRNNCGPGLVEGPPLNYLVEAYKYTSTVSPEEADAKAQHEVETEGPAFANANCECMKPYARIVTEITADNTESGATWERVNIEKSVYLKFYADFNLTIPYTFPTNISVNYTAHENHQSQNPIYNYNQSYNRVLTVPAGESKVLLGQFSEDCFYSYGNLEGDCTEHTFTLRSGSDYTVR